MEKIFKDSYSYRAIIVAAFAGMLATFFILEYHGKIKHSEVKDDFIVGEYKGVMLDAGDSHRLSRKQNNQLAICQEGFLVIESYDGSNLRALIVDYKNRAVRCAL